MTEVGEPPKRRGRPPAGGAPAQTDAIMRAALRVFARDGFGGASVAAINRELGVSHNMLNQRFGSKEALWYAMVDWISDNIAHEMDTGPELDPAERMREGTIRFIEFHARNPDILRLITTEAAIAGPRLDYLYDHHISPMLASVTDRARAVASPKRLSRSELRSLHFLIAHGATAPFTLAPLAERIGPNDPATAREIRRHAEFVADVLDAGVRARLGS